MNAPNYIGNAISEYKLTKFDLFGHLPDKKESYDKLSIIMISLNEKCDHGEDALLHMLNVLLSDTMEVSQKAKILSEEYHIPMDDHFGKEFDKMCNLSEIIEERGQISSEIRIIRRKLSKGFSPEDIADWTELDIHYVNLIQFLIQCHPDDSDRELASLYCSDYMYRMN